MVVETLRLHIIKKDLHGFSLARVTSRISWSVIDQATFSGAGLFLNMFLIWMLPGDGYGRFAVSFAVFLMLSGAHDSFVLEPVSVLGSSIPPAELGQYMSILLFLHVGVCLAITAISITAYSFIPLGGVMEVVIVMSLVLPLILLSWTARRMCYITSQSKVAAIGSFVYLMAVVGFSWCAAWSGWLSPSMGFVIMALASIPAAGTILARLPVGPTRLNPGSILREMLRISKEHWRLGRWVSFQKLFDIATNQLGIILTSVLVGVTAAGVLRALTFTVMPLLQITTAICGMLALPIMAREYGRGNIQRVRQLTSKLTLGIVVMALGYLAVLTLLQQPITRFISLAGDVPSTWIVALKGVSPVIVAIGGGVAIALRATQRVAYYPLSAAIPGIFAAICTPLLVMSWGLTGAIVSGIAVSIVTTVLGIGMYRKWV